MTSTDSTSAPPPLRRLVGRRPQIGAAAAAKQVAEDLSALLRAEIALAKAEAAEAVRTKAQGAALFVVAAVLGWLGVQALLLTIGFLLALVLPGWAAALMVTALLLLGAGICALVGRRHLAQQVALAATKANLDADRTAAQAALERAKEHALADLEQTKQDAAAAAEEVKERLNETAEEVKQRLNETTEELKGRFSETTQALRTVAARAQGAPSGGAREDGTRGEG